jgi:hypothetical protein
MNEGLFRRKTLGPFLEGASKVKKEKELEERGG